MASSSSQEHNIEPQPPPSSSSSSNDANNNKIKEKENENTNEENNNNNKGDGGGGVVILHRTKTIQMFGRSTPIVLQNDNGPCPLLAICNVLLLKNQLTLNPEISEVSQEKLLSLVAERLIDSNSNVENKDAEYVENQQRNIADAIDLLPRLTTGIDVNIRFRRIDDFEFTPECAIFDLLDIPLYHGWLVDPQDHETAEAIGSKSYNTVMGDLVSLETRKMKDEGSNKVDEDCVDFAAATAATLGVPSPNLSRTKSFEESPRSDSDQQMLRKGDALEEAELLRAMKLSENETYNEKNESVATAASEGDMPVTYNENMFMMKSTPEDLVQASDDYGRRGTLDLEPSVSYDHGICDTRVPSSCEEKADCLNVEDGGERHVDEVFSVQPVEGILSNDVVRCAVDLSLPSEPTVSLSPVKDNVNDGEVESMSSPVADLTDRCKQIGEVSTSTLMNGDSESFSGRIPEMGSFTSSLDGSEPIYEGEECILDSGKIVCEDREPVYEGEVVLATQADKETTGVCDMSQKDEITRKQGELIGSFLKSNASQLTFYGLFCLLEGLKERELCVFFRNNHFNTMFKFEGELYLLATDQGYLNQPDLVWEKLNEVNGDTLFVTSNFKEFRLESSANGSWDEHNAVASTADFLATIDSSTQDGSNINSDLQLAIALQQQEFEQQPQRQGQQQQSSTGPSRLTTGPQVPRSSGRAMPSSARQEQKPKEKSNCKLM